MEYWRNRLPSSPPQVQLPKHHLDYITPVDFIRAGTASTEVRSLNLGISFHHTMTGLKYSTPYTPVFPDPVDELVEENGFSSSDESTRTIVPQKSYVGTLKERYLNLTNLPEVLCTSREPSPEYEARVVSIRQLFNNAREQKRPLPEITLTCVGLKGGDWVGSSVSEEDDNDIAFVFSSRTMPETDEDWFEVKRMLDDRRAKRKLVSERQEQVVQWVGQVEVGVVQNQPMALVSQQNSQNQEFEHYEHKDSFGDINDPVDRATSPPPAPRLDVLGSFSEPNSQVFDYPVPSILPLPGDCDNATVKSMESNQNAQRLSSPVSPPRSLQPLKPLTDTQLSFPVSSKRNRDSFEQDQDDVEVSQPFTPAKRPRAGVEPITPVSVQKSSQDRRNSQETRRVQEASSQEHKVPPMIDLLAHQKPQKRFKVSPGSQRYKSPDIELSQPSYSRFQPQFESTQRRDENRGTSPVIEMSLLPPSSGAELYYQSQFNIEEKVDMIDEVLRKNAEVFSIGSD